VIRLSARIFTAKVAENTVQYGIYDRLLHKLLWKLDAYLERRGERQWEQLKWRG